jgi:hypothetical protein
VVCVLVVRLMAQFWISISSDCVRAWERSKTKGRVEWEESIKSLAPICALIFTGAGLIVEAER